MFIAMNRFKVNNGFENDFENVWRERDSKLEEVLKKHGFEIIKDETEVLIEEIKTELKNSQAWINQISMTYKLDLVKTNELLDEWIAEQELKGGLDRPLKEIKSHFINIVKNNKNKLSYSYLLTPSGIEAKATLTIDFLKRKMAEYENLKTEIEELKSECSPAGQAPTKNTEIL